MKSTLLFISAIAFAGIANGQTIPNSSFENWENLQGGSNPYSEPIDWNSANECAELLDVQSVSQSTDAHSGSSSAKLETKAAPIGSLKINGVLTTSQMICDPFNPGQTGGHPETSRPDSLVAWLKYAPQATDNGYIQVIFFGSGGATDTLSYNKFDINNALSDWTRIVFAIDWWSTNTPVNVSILFNSSWGNGNNGEAEVGSIMYVDDVEWTTTVPEGVAELQASKWNLFPNPVVNELNIINNSNGSAKLEVIDITGKTIVERELTEPKAKINMGNLAAGVYLYQLRTLKNEVIKTGKLLINP